MKAFPIYYDFRVAPLTFDFAVFLAIGYGHAIKNGFETIDVYLIRPYFRRSNQIEATYKSGYDEWKFQNVVMTLLSITKCLNNIYIIRDGDVELYSPRYPIDYHPDKVDLSSKTSQIPTNFVHLKPLFDGHEKPFIFRSTDVARKWIAGKYGKFDVCLTLRTAIQKPERNINLDDWYHLYQEIDNLGLRPVVIPDHDDVFTEGHFRQYDWDCVEEAGSNLELRLATYELANKNISWACGMYTLLFFSGVDFLIFGKWDDAEVTSSRDFLTRKGPIIGTQFSWADPDQQVIDWTERSELDRTKLIANAKDYLAASIY